MAWGLAGAARGGLEVVGRWWQAVGSSAKGGMREWAARPPEEGGPARCPRCAVHGAPLQATMPLVVVGAARGRCLTQCQSQPPSTGCAAQAAQPAALQWQRFGCVAVGGVAHRGGVCRRTSTWFRCLFTLEKTTPIAAGAMGRVAAVTCTHPPPVPQQMQVALGRGCLRCR